MPTQMGNRLRRAKAMLSATVLAEQFGVKTLSPKNFEIINGNLEVESLELLCKQSLPKTLSKFEDQPAKIFVTRGLFITIGNSLLARSGRASFKDLDEDTTFRIRLPEDVFIRRDNGRDAPYIVTQPLALVKPEESQLLPAPAMAELVVSMPVKYPERHGVPLTTYLGVLDF